MLTFAVVCHQSISFPEQNYRESAIDYTKGTCKWLLEHSTFKTWLRECQSLLWIKGKPGAGKPTLIKYAVDNCSVMLPGSVTVSFFFDARGVSLQNTALGMYRSIIHQLFLYFPEEFTSLVKKFEQQKNHKGEVGKGWQWTEKELRDYFINALKNTSLKRQIVLLVDALDESGEECAIKLVDIFTKLKGSVEGLSGKLKICFACRHYPIISFEGRLTIGAEQNNWNDIALITRERLERIQNLKQHERHILETVMAQKSSGIFQWAVIIVEEVKKSKMRGQGIGAVQ